MRWTSYTQTDAYATGVDWAKFGPGPLSIDRFKIDGQVKLHVYRPRAGVFTRLAYSATSGHHHYHGAITARRFGQYWDWG